MALNKLLNISASCINNVRHSIKNRVPKLLAEISELRKENADVKAENTKLKQAMEENVELKSRVEELEKNRTDSDAENVELRARVMKLEQK